MKERDPMKAGSERVEYRVRCTEDSGVETTWAGLTFEQPKLADKALEMALRHCEARIQQRTVIETPWTDIDQEGSQDG